MEQENLRLNSYKISGDSNLLDEINHLNPEVKRILDELRPDIEKGRKHIIKKVNKLCLKYPRVPVLKNILSNLYQQNGNSNQAFAVNQWILKEHPNYLYGKLNHAAELLLKGKPEGIPAIMGEAMEIGDLFPQRKEFHIEEVVGFYIIAIQYFLAVDKIEEAEIRMKILEDIDEDHPKTVYGKQLMKQWYLTKAAARHEEENKTRKSVELKDNRSHLQTTQAPEFHFPEEMNWLYENDLGIDPEKIKHLLHLERGKLINDLEKVLHDSIVRFDYFVDKVNKENFGYNNIDFPLHALLLLADLRSEQSLNSILSLLKQDDNFIHFWFADFINLLTEDALFHCGKHQTETIFEFLKHPNIHHFNKAVVGEALVKIIEKSKINREVFTEKYREVLQVYIQNAANENFTDTEAIGFIISDVVDLGYKELLPEIKKLIDLGLVDLFICGTYKDMERDIEAPFNRESPGFFEKDLFEKYEELKQFEANAADSNSQANLYSDTYHREMLNKELSFHKPPPPVNNSNKSGRNDPCPCGSGKKYKKCCL